MQFTLLAVVSFIAAAIATPISPLQLRQSAAAVDASVPSMTDAQGNVISFSSTGVFQAAKDSGM